MNLCTVFVLAATWAGVSGTPLAPDTGRTASGLFWTAEGAGPSVVLVHAFSLDHRMWDPIVEVLARDHRVVRMDLRGHGDSPDPEGPYSTYLDVMEVMDAAGVDAAWLVGLSAGSQAAADLALEAPDRVRGLVLASPALSGYTPVGSFDWFRPVGEALQSGGPEAAARAWAATAIMDVGPDPVMRAAVEGWVMDNASLWGLPGNPDQPADPGAFSRMGDLTVPALVLAGERDLVDTRRIAALLGYCLPEGRLEVLAARGHMLALEDPEGFTERVLEFVDGVGAGSGGAGGSGGRAGSGDGVEAPPGCRGGEDLWGPGSFAPFAGFVGGTWEMGDVRQILEWAPGRKGVMARQFRVGPRGEGEPGGAGDSGTGETLREVSRLLWIRDPRSGTFEGRGVAVGMGIDQLFLSTSFTDGVMVSEVTAFGPEAPDGVLREEWRPEGPDRYRWVLLGPEGDSTMEGAWIRSWRGSSR